MATKEHIQVVVEGCKRGERPAQRELYDMLSRKLFSICLRYSSDYADAEDMLQEGFIKIYTNIKKYDSSGSFPGWASRVVANSCIDCIRRKPSLYTISDEFAEQKKAPDVGIVDRMIGEDLLKIIQSLPSGYRTVFNMYVMEGYSHKEIGEKLNISDGTSKSQLNRARVLLKKKLEAWEGISLARKSNA